jgi:Rrf2 family protein
MLSQAVGYAATALGYIAAAGGKSVAVKDVAKACSIPGPYLAKIIHSLSRGGLVTTQRGIGGGVVLAREPRLVSLYDLCVALDDPIIQNRCMLGVAECSDERNCPTHKFWKAHRVREIEFLEQTSIADIAAFETRRRWSAPAKLTINQTAHLHEEPDVRRAGEL